MTLEPHHLLFLLSVLFLIIEIFTISFIGGAISIGFLFSGIGNYMGLSTEWQIILFIIGCAVGFFSIKRIANQFFYPEDIQTNSIVGDEGEIINSKRIKINGSEWNYKTEEAISINPGTRAKVLAREGSTLIVKPTSTL